MESSTEKATFETLPSTQNQETSQPDAQLVDQGFKHTENDLEVKAQQTGAVAVNESDMRTSGTHSNAGSLIVSANVEDNQEDTGNDIRVDEDSKQSAKDAGNKQSESAAAADIPFDKENEPPTIEYKKEVEACTHTRVPQDENASSGYNTVDISSVISTQVQGIDAESVNDTSTDVTLLSEEQKCSGLPESVIQLDHVNADGSSAVIIEAEQTEDLQVTPRPFETSTEGSSLSQVNENSPASGTLSGDTVDEESQPAELPAQESVETIDIENHSDPVVPAAEEPGDSIDTESLPAVPSAQEPGDSIDIESPTAVPSAEEPGEAVDTQSPPAVPPAEEPGEAIDTESHPAVPPAEEPGEAIDTESPPAVSPAQEPSEAIDTESHPAVPPAEEPGELPQEERNKGERSESTSMWYTDNKDECKRDDSQDATGYSTAVVGGVVIRRPISSVLPKEPKKLSKNSSKEKSTSSTRFKMAWGSLFRKKKFQEKSENGKTTVSPEDKIEDTGSVNKTAASEQLDVSTSSSNTDINRYEKAASTETPLAGPEKIEGVGKTGESCHQEGHHLDIAADNVTHDAATLQPSTEVLLQSETDGNRLLEDSDDAVQGTPKDHVEIEAKEAPPVTEFSSGVSPNIETEIRIVAEASDAADAAESTTTQSYENKDVVQDIPADPDSPTDEDSVLRERIAKRESGLQPRVPKANQMHMRISYAEGSSDGGKEVEVIGTRAVPVRQKNGNLKVSPDHRPSCRELGDVDHEGWLTKRGGGTVFASWKRKWVILKEQRLYYYKTSFDPEPGGVIHLEGYQAIAAPEIKRKFCFNCEVKGVKASRTTFAADTEEDMNKWLEILTKACKGEVIFHQTHHKKDDTPVTMRKKTNSSSKPKRTGSVLGIGGGYEHDGELEHHTVLQRRASHDSLPQESQETKTPPITSEMHNQDKESAEKEHREGTVLDIIGQAEPVASSVENTNYSSREMGDLATDTTSNDAMLNLQQESAHKDESADVKDHSSDVLQNLNTPVPDQDVPTKDITSGKDAETSLPDIAPISEVAAASDEIDNQEDFSTPQIAPLSELTDLYVTGDVQDADISPNDILPASEHAVSSVHGKATEIIHEHEAILQSQPLTTDSALQPELVPIGETVAVSSKTAPSLESTSAPEVASNVSESEPTFKLKQEELRAADKVHVVSDPPCNQNQHVDSVPNTEGLGVTTNDCKVSTTEVTSVNSSNTDGLGENSTQKVTTSQTDSTAHDDEVNVKGNVHDVCSPEGDITKHGVSDISGVSEEEKIESSCLPTSPQEAYNNSRTVWYCVLDVVKNDWVIPAEGGESPTDQTLQQHTPLKRSSSNEDELLLLVRTIKKARLSIVGTPLPGNEDRGRAMSNVSTQNDDILKLRELKRTLKDKQRDLMAVDELLTHDVDRHSVNEWMMRYSYLSDDIGSITEVEECDSPLERMSSESEVEKQVLVDSFREEEQCKEQSAEKIEEIKPNDEFANDEESAVKEVTESKRDDEQVTVLEVSTVENEANKQECIEEEDSINTRL